MTEPFKFVVSNDPAKARQAIGTLGVPADYDVSGSGDYMVNDVVRYTDPSPSPTTDLTGLYVCITDHTSGSPKDYPARWELVSAASYAALSGFGGETDGRDTILDGGKLVARNPLYIDPTQAPYNVKFDRFTSQVASMSSSSNPTQLTIAGYAFTADDIGKKIKVYGAGSGGANLKTTITGVSSGKAVLASPCLTTITNGNCMFGTDNYAALQQLFDDLSVRSRNDGPRLSRAAILPAGVAMYFGTLTLPRLGTLKGACENWLGYDLTYGFWQGIEASQGTVLYQGWDCNADGARVRDVNTGQHDWAGVLDGIAFVQDIDNTSGSGIVFKNADGAAVGIIDGGTLRRVAALGWANKGFDFAGGVITAVLRDLYAFANGYMDRKVFTADTTNGSTTLSNVSDFTGLAFCDRISGPGIPTDAVIQSLNPGAGTITISRSATATATGVSIERVGSPGIGYQVRGYESVHFDGVSGDQNSGGLIRFTGATGNQPAAIHLSTIKNEYGANTYRGSNDVTVTPSVPQGANAIVCHNMVNTMLTITAGTHWADASSSVGGSTPNTLGRDIGAAILVDPSSAAPEITWYAQVVRLAAGSGQSVGYAYRDCFSNTIQPVPTNVAMSGTNTQRAQTIRIIADASVTVYPRSPVCAWSSLTAARTATLPAISAVPPGFQVKLMDSSGSASATNTITAIAAGTDTIVGDAFIASPYRMLVLESDGTRWRGAVNVGSSPSVLRDNNGNPEILFTTVASAVNYLGVANGSTGNPPQISALGTDANVSFLLAPKGTGAVQIYAGAGITPRILANGADTDVSLNLQSKNAGKVRINGVEAVRRTIQSVTSSVTLAADGDRVVLIGASGAPTLPTAVANTCIYRCKNVDTTSKTIATTSSQTIDGSTTLVLPAGSAVDIVSDGSNWVVL